VLFKQANGPNLYKITAEREEDVEALAKTEDYSEENVVAYPSNMGITGKACEEKKIIVANKGEMDPLFAPEVDNFCSAGIIGNMMVGPLVDLDGNLKGVVQLFNKLSSEEANQISVQDKEELNCILTSLGEIVKSADQHYEF
jgi:uncharacterized protein YciI